MAKKSKKLNQKNIMSGLIIFFMVSSVFGVMFYGFSSSVQKQKYKDWTFTLTQQGVMTKIDGKKLLFQYFPQDVEDINISAQATALLKANALYITYDPTASYYREMALLQYNLQQFLSDTQGSYALISLTRPYQDALVPIITCMNATPTFPVIEIIESNTTMITDSGSCVIIEIDTSFNFERVLDRIKYALLGII